MIRKKGISKNRVDAIRIRISNSGASLKEIACEIDISYGHLNNKLNGFKPLYKEEYEAILKAIEKLQNEAKQK